MKSELNTRHSSGPTAGLTNQRRHMQKDIQEIEREVRAEFEEKIREAISEEVNEAIDNEREERGKPIL
jgi:hypothetical protein